MAGTYTDVPAARIPYDRDGSVGITIDNSNQTTVLTSGQLLAINDESNTNPLSLPAYGSLVIVFSQPTDVKGVFFAFSGAMAVNLTTYTSTNTTNGIDGTWVVFRSSTSNSAVSPAYRSNIFSVGSAVNGVKAIKFVSSYSTTSSCHCVHVYGKVSDYSGDRLVFWHPTLDQPLDITPAYFDYGDVPQNSAAIERDFRLKNISTTLSANTITVSCEAPTDSSPTSYVSQTTFRYDGGVYGATASLATLAPGQISSVFTAKLTVTSTATLSVWTQRYIAQAANWS